MVEMSDETFQRVSGKYTKFYSDVLCRLICFNSNWREDIQTRHILKEIHIRYDRFEVRDLLKQSRDGSSAVVGGYGLAL